MCWRLLFVKPQSTRLNNILFCHGCVRTRRECCDGSLLKSTTLGEEGKEEKDHERERKFRMPRFVAKYQTCFSGNHSKNINTNLRLYRKPSSYSNITLPTRDITYEKLQNNHTTYISTDEVTFPAISISIKLQSDSTPFAVSFSRQPCNIISPVAVALNSFLTPHKHTNTKMSA